MRKIATSFLDTLLRIKSYKLEEKVKCADLIKNELLSIGFQVDLIYGFGAPIVLADLETASDTNILFYSHYDVKPEGDLSKWKTDPFVPFYDIKTSKIYARGAGDDKGQLFATIEAIRSAIEEKRKIAYNITLLIEGDEENGSPGLDDFCNDVLSRKEFDAVIVTDSHWLDEQPVMYTGARGQMSISLNYNDDTMKENLHAGNFGGKKIGAARKFLSYLNSILLEIESLMSQGIMIDKGYANAVSLTYINSGDEARSMIPNSIVAKLDVRVVDVVLVKKIYEILERWYKCCDIKYTITQYEKGYYNKPNKEFVKKVSKYIKEMSGKKMILHKYCGAYIPLEKLKKVNGIKYVIPLAQSDEHNHAPNENISIWNIYYGIDVIKNLIVL